MAQVVRNPDETLTVTLSTWEKRVIQRWAQDANVTIAQQFTQILDGFLANKRNDYRNADGPTKQAKYEALTPAKQAEVDAILNTAVV